MYVLLNGISLFLLSCGDGGGPQMGLSEIAVYETRAEEINIYQEFVGQVYGYKDIAIRARVEGFLEGVYFQEGSHVRQGTKLYTIESQPFEADIAAKMSRLAEAQTMPAKESGYYPKTF
ncbi:MAG: biotin/lipoyl-binding protein [Calditrichales bacterium]|nr:MAG: biotin/lipoyl-binding protein [Calditrichales bacterium]